jgi:AAA family ATP:ADP antiporter
MGIVLKGLLKKAFDIRDGEGKRALLMQLNIFLIIFTLFVVKPTATGLFLGEIGVEQLPLAFLLVAGLAIIVSTVYNRFLGQAPLNRIILITLLSSVALFIFFGILLQIPGIGNWVYFGFYLWVSIFGVLTASQFWILANVVFNVREAKRLFGFIGAGAIASGILGGYFTTFAAEWLGSEQMPFVGAGLLFLCVPNVIYIWKKYVQSTQSTFQRRRKITKTERPLRLIRKSSHLTFLAAIVGISVIVARLVDYQFNAIASQKISDPDELTSFFGFWFSTFNVLSLFFQLLLTRRVVGRLGVGGSLFFLPLSILTGAILLFFMPELWAAIFIKMSDGSLKQSINKASVELLSLPVSAEIKNKTKTFIDVVVDSIATGIGGLILIFVVNGFQLSPRFISLFIIALIVCWLYFVRQVRKTYLNAFKLNIQQVKQEGDLPLDLNNASIVSDLMQVLEKGTEGQVLHILKKLKARPDDRFADPLFQLLQRHPSDRVKEEAIRNLYFIKSPTYLEEIRKFTEHPSPNIKVAAFDYLIAHSPENTNEMMEQYLRDDDPHIQLTALISLAEESRDNPVLKEKFELKKRLQTQYEQLEKQTDHEDLVFHKIGLLKALGFAKLDVFFPLLEASTKDKNPKIASQAIQSAGDTLHPHFLPLLIQSLSKPTLAEASVNALKKYGPAVVDVLSNYCREEGAPVRVVMMIPRVAEHFGIQASADLLFYLLKNENVNIRLAALRALNELRIGHSHLNFYEKEVLPLLLKEAILYQDTLSILYVQQNVRKDPAQGDMIDQKENARRNLIRLLETRLDWNLERIFRLLGLKYPPEDVIFVLENIQNPQSDLRVNALEYLENLLDFNLKKVLMPIVETALLDSISEKAIRNLHLQIPDEEECYRLLEEKGDEELRRAVQRLR